MTDKSNVARKIEEDAQQLKLQMLEQAKAKAEQILKAAKSEKKEKLKIAKSKAVQRKAEMHKTELLKAKSEINREILQLKLESIDAIISKALEELKTPDKKQFSSFAGKILSDSDLKEGEVVIGKSEKIIKSKDIIDIAKKHKIKLKECKEKANFEFGAKIISGRATYDISPYDYFKSYADTLRIEIASILFVEEG